MLETTLDDAGILRLKMSSPPANTLSEAMLDHLTQAFVTPDEAARVIILEADGKLFCAGHDLKELSTHRQDDDRGRAYFHNIMTRCGALMQAIVACRVPVIAKVDGLATAAGCQLVATCDLAVASTHARFCTPGVNIGLFCSTPMVALTRNLNAKHAMEMLLLGDALDANDALRMGLVNRVVTSDQLEAETYAFAAKIASKSNHVLKIGKRAFYDQISLNLEDAYRHCAQVMTENMLARDAEEGISAVLEKRNPVWKDQ